MKLVDNAVDSFKKAFEKLMVMNEDKLNQAQEFEVKDIILGFHHSFEIFFKVLLEKREKAFIYDDVQKYFESEFDKIIKSKDSTGTRHTVSYIQAFKRVYVIYKINDDGTLFPNVDKLNGWRNALTHQESTLNSQEVKLVLANILYYLLPFLNDIIEFKQFSFERQVEDHLNKLEEISKIWKLKRYLFILNFAEDITLDINKQKYKTVLFDLGITDYDEIATEEITAHIMCNFQSFLLGNKNSLCQLVNKDNSICFKNAITRLIHYRLGICKIITIEKSLQKEDMCINRKLSINNLSLKEKYKLFFISKSLEDILSLSENSKDIGNIEITFSFSSIRDNVFKMKISKFIEDINKLLCENGLCLDDKNYISNIIENAIDDTLYGEVMDLLWDKYAGEFGEISTIDRIDEVYIYGEYMICEIINTNKFSVVYEVAASTEWYSDHDYYSNGAVYEIIQQNISIVDGEITITDSKII